MKKKIFIIMPAYNVSDLIEETIKRIPQPIWQKISELVIINDGSRDDTTKTVARLKRKYKKIKLIDKKKNEGYARAQKTGFTYALGRKADIVVLLHSDGQYAPEEMPKLLQPLENEIVDMVQGSRMVYGGALKGGMPLYKYIANKSLSFLENLVYGMNLAEYHSGYMLYSKKALETINFIKLSDTFHFDGEMLFMGNKKGLIIQEIGIPTRYAGETSNLKPIKYGIDVLKIMWNYKRGKYDF